MLTIGQQIVLDHHLSFYSDDVSFDTIIEEMRGETYEHYGVWEAFEDWEDEKLADHMEAIAKDIDGAIHKEKLTLLEEIKENIK